MEVSLLLLVLSTLHPVHIVNSLPGVLPLPELGSRPPPTLKSRQTSSPHVRSPGEVVLVRRLNVAVAAKYLHHRSH